MALVLALALAGCSTLAPPPAAQDEPEENASLPIPRLTPTLPRDPQTDCVAVTVTPATGGPMDVMVDREEGLSFEVRLHSSCEGATALAFAGRCPGQLFLVEVYDDVLFEHAELEGHGAAYAAERPCPPHDASAAAPTLPAGYALERQYGWNATYAVPCARPAAADCYEHVAAREGHHEVIAVAEGADGTVWTASWRFSVHAYCARITVEDPTPGPHDATLSVDNRTHSSTAWTAGETVGTFRWCGEPGAHWVRYQDHTRAASEEGTFDLTARELILRVDPLRIEPAPWAWPR